MGKLSEKAPAEVALGRSPLVKVLCQVRFPLQLSIRNDDQVARFQEELRKDYPFLNKEMVHSFRVEGHQVQGGAESAVLWRFDDRKIDYDWRITLSTEFVTLETGKYLSRQDFVERLRKVILAVENVFSPGGATRIGLRYVNHISGNDMSSLEYLLNPPVLGILSSSSDECLPLRKAVMHSITEAMFEADEGRLQAKWGKLPALATHDPAVLRPIDSDSWIFDFDMFSTEILEFDADKIIEICESFSKRVYYVFRLMVKTSFLEHFGGDE
ncbi:TIGR04255 family protein [Thalassospira xiamenensis]|jgi:uncharacterized protein (TIGR04255 family)|uniref:TIGR04255 family protein n=1 Tax=Thalassospira xiamenensis TaxID=220697 RepID=UPI001FFFD408|nr:TIGR04255 family protein [Thalassospira xiamenensis]MCK2166397.1 TIGR04255 family protein [Thalassospira xiamenensis]